MIAGIARHVRRIRPDVVITFGPDGAYGHPDHVAISQFTTAAIVAAADARRCRPTPTPADRRTRSRSSTTWPGRQSTWAAYEAAFRQLISTVDGVERQATPWPDWAITTVIDTRAFWPTVWRAVSCHQSQVAAYERLSDLSPEHHEALWGWQSFYRVFSIVNGGRVGKPTCSRGFR